MIEFERHAYVANTPGLSPFERGAKSTEGLDDANRESIERFVNKVGALVQGNDTDTERWAIMRQTNAATSIGANILAETLDGASQAAGFDVQGELARNTWNAPITLAEADQRAFNFKEPEVPKTVYARISSVAFGSLQTEVGTNWQLSVIDFLTSARNQDGDKVEIVNRLINFVEMPQETDES